jgi:hypothetical protein
LSACSVPPAMGAHDGSYLLIEAGGGISPPGARTTSGPLKPTTTQGTASSPSASWAGCPSLSPLAKPVAMVVPHTGYRPAVRAG